MPFIAMEESNRMVKGINKQIIEIKCSKSEQFEKILLFLKSDTDATTVRLMEQEIGEVCSDYLGSTKKTRRRSRHLSPWTWALLALLLAGFLLGSVFCWYLLFS